MEAVTDVDGVSWICGTPGMYFAHQFPKTTFIGIGVIWVSLLAIVTVIVPGDGYRYFGGCFSDDILRVLNEITKTTRDAEELRGQKFVSSCALSN